MLFKDIPGQKETANHLREMAHQNRLSHALLFLSKEGVGALPLALAFSQYLICEKTNGRPQTQSSSLFDDATLSEQKTGTYPEDACGECPACIRAQQFIHPDIHFSYPVFPPKAGVKPISTHFVKEWRGFLAENPYGNVFDWLQFIGVENQQGNITAEECNNIIRTLSLKSFEGGMKILILWLPEYLGKEGNRLLKLIEEPPADTLFILVSQSEGLILPTLISRCQLIQVPAMDAEEMMVNLEKKYGVTRERAVQVAGIAAGNYREAMQIMQHAEEDWQATISQWLNIIIKKMLAEQLKWIEETSKLGREKQKQLLRYFLHLCEISIRIEYLAPEVIKASEKEVNFSKRLQNVVSVSQLEAIAGELTQAIYYIERNANPKLLFHALTIKLYHIIQEKTLILTA